MQVKDILSCRFASDPSFTFIHLRCFPILLLNKERYLSFTLYLLQVLNCYCPRLLSADFSCIMNESFQNFSYVKYYDCFWGFL